MVAERNVKLEAFKHAIEQSKIRRAEGFRERGEMSKKLSEQLEVMALSPEQKRQVTQKFHMQQDEYLRETRKQVTISDFTFLDVIGAGGFGIVRLCQKNDTGEVFAIKQMRKGDMVHRNHVRHIRAEKDALCNAQADWVIGLHYTFQDDTFLYMVMDYLPGGDLMTHLQRKDTFTEPETRFYIAELVEAVDYIHTKLHCIHRDIKPDNIVFDAKGHIHLVDFGLCKHNVPPERQAAGRAASPAACPRHPAREELHSVVGTPDYMAPEAFAEGPCGRECDWWSVGIIMFEMLFGGPPFSGADHEASVTAARVKSWRQYFRMPRDPQVGRDARDLLEGLICDPEDRLTADEIRAHPFFRGLDFGGLRRAAPPIRPVVRGSMDTSNFDDFKNVAPQFRVGTTQRQASTDPTLFAFHDYSFRRDLEAKKPSVAEALKSAVPEPAALAARPAPRVHPSGGLLLALARLSLTCSRGLKDA